MTDYFSRRARPPRNVFSRAVPRAYGYKPFPRRFRAKPRFDPFNARVPTRLTRPKRTRGRVF